MMAIKAPDDSYGYSDTWGYGQRFDEQNLLNSIIPVLSPEGGLKGLKDQVEGVLDALPFDMLNQMAPMLGEKFTDKPDAIQKLTDAITYKGAFHGSWGDKLQELLDGIKSIFTPGSTNTPVKDAIEVLLGIKSAAEIAEKNAELALIGVEGILAEKAGGAYDEFEYPIADALDPTKYTVFYGGAGTGTYGPNGNGILVYKPKGVGARSVWYRQNTAPIAKQTGFVTVVLSDAPAAVAKDSYVYVCGQWDAASQARVQARVNPTGQLLGDQTTTAQFQTVDASGAVTDIGSSNSNIPKLEDGDVLQLSWDQLTVSFKRNGIVAHTVAHTVLPGQCVGFGAGVPNYLGKHPGAAFAGLAWHG